MTPSPRKTSHKSQVNRRRSSDCDLQLHRLPPDELLAGGIWGITTRRRRCQAPALRRPPSPNREKVTAGGALTRSSSSSSSRSDFGPFSALRSFDDADPRELAGEGWDSDADWGYGGPEPCCADVDGRVPALPSTKQATAGRERERCLY